MREKQLRVIFTRSYFQHSAVCQALCAHTAVKQALISAVLLAAAPAAFAQDDGQSVQIGQADFFPSVELSYISNSNAFLTPDNDVEATAVAVAPRLEYRTDQRQFDASFVYEGDFASYSEDALDYDDHLLSLSSTLFLGTRQRVRGSLQFDNTHQVLGTLLTRGNADENSEQIETSELEAIGSFIYGANQARGNLELGLRLANFDFLNREDVTSGRDLTEVEPFGIFTYRVSPDTRLLAELRYGVLRFDDEQRDYDEISVLGGVVLADGQKTSGIIRLGVSLLDFANSDAGDETTFVVDVQLAYEPVDFSQFRLRVGREIENADNTAAGVVSVRDLIRLDWNHQWSSRITSDVFLSRRATSFDCPTVDVQTVSAGLQIGVAVRRWLTLGAGIQTANRTSGECDSLNDADLDFEQQIGNVFLRATL